MEPGIEKMRELAKRERMQARMPPVEEVENAFNHLFQAKRRKGSTLTDTEAQLAAQSLRYILASRKTRDEQGQAVTDRPPSRRREFPSRKTVDGVFVVLSDPSSGSSDAHVDLARMLYGMELKGSSWLRSRALMAYIHTLSHSGQTTLAKDIVLQYEQSTNGSQQAREKEEDLMDDDGELALNEQSEKSYAAYVLWPILLRGFVQENNETEVRRVLSIIEAKEAFGTSECADMIDFSIQRNDLNEMKRWWTLYLQANNSATPTAENATARILLRIFKWCLTNNELDTGHKIVRDIMNSNPPKPLWDATLFWAAGTKKSVDEIDRMLTVMEKSNESISDRSEWRVPDIDTINGLVEFAISVNDPYMAERFIALGRDRSIEPNAKTLVLQMEYRLSVNDVDGALIAYKNLQAQDTSANEDLRTVNRLIVALCQSNRHDFDTIMNVAADLSDRRARFEAQTVSALSLLHLNRDESDDVIDLLNTHAFHYSSAERQNIRDAIRALCLDPKTPTSLVWSGYNVLKTVFDEMPRSERTELMTSFLDRERADMAVHVFQNMRTHSRADTFPAIDTYVAAFMGLAKLRDLESLEVIHNLLKLDYNIDTTTYLNNALMIAYTACGKPRIALGFWNDIVTSREGPTYNSIHAALRACEKAPWGDIRAKEIWELLRSRNVELDQSLWASYIAALAGNGDVQAAIGTIEVATDKGEMEVDEAILGNLYAAVGNAKQVEVEEFARQRHPDVWRRLEEVGLEVDEEGSKSFKIDRKVGP